MGRRTCGLLLVAVLARTWVNIYVVDCLVTSLLFPLFATTTVETRINLPTLEEASKPKTQSVSQHLEVVSKPIAQSDRAQSTMEGKARSRKHEISPASSEYVSKRRHLDERSDLLKLLPTKPQQDSAFFHLACEIRDKIYEEALGTTLMVFRYQNMSIVAAA